MRNRQSQTAELSQKLLNYWILILLYLFNISGINVSELGSSNYCKVDRNTSLTYVKFHSFLSAIMLITYHFFSHLVFLYSWPVWKRRPFGAEKMQIWAHSQGPNMSVSQATVGHGIGRLRQTTHGSAWHRRFTTMQKWLRPIRRGRVCMLSISQTTHRST